MEFNELKDELLKRAKSRNACEKGYAMGLRSNSKADLLKTITDNWFWVFRNAKIVDAQFLEEHFTQEELNQAGIFTQKVHVVTSMNAFACGSSTVEAYGSSTITAYDSSTVTACDSSTITAYDSSTVTACDSSTITAYDSSTVKACGSSTIKACDSSTITAYGSSTVKACGSSTVTAYDSSTVKACDSSTVEAYSNSYVENRTGKEILPQSDYAIVKDYHKHKIYIKKSKFEIVEVE